MRKNKSQKGQYLQKVIDLRSSGVSFLGISKIIPVSEATVRRWCAKFAPELYYVDFMTKKKTLREKHVRDSVSLPSDVEALQAEILRLKSELTKAEIKAEAYDEMINVAESELGISIRKKSGAKQ